VPRGTLAAFPSLARESLVLRPEGRLNLTAATAGCATHRPAIRRPDPSALPAGTPTRISRSNRVGPSGQLLTVGPQEVGVKAAFPLARRICPAHDGRITSMEFPGDEPNLRPRAPGCHRFSGTATGGDGAHVRGLLPGAPLQAPAAYACKVLLSRHLLERPSRDGRSRHASRVIAAGTARWSILTGRASACPSQRIRAVTSGQRRLLLQWSRRGLADCRTLYVVSGLPEVLHVTLAAVVGASRRSPGRDLDGLTPKEVRPRGGPCRLPRALPAVGAHERRP
jgi:hypothetical protein